MASTILVKRSTGTTVPSSLEFGELAITVGAGTPVSYTHLRAHETN